MLRITAVVALTIAPLFATPSRADETSEQILSRIAFGSCANQDRPVPIWETITGTKPDLMILLGDNIYADTYELEVMRAKYKKLGENPGFRKFREQVPIMATWDDHDYGWNDAGVEYPLKDKSQIELLNFFEVPEDSYRRERKGVYYSKLFGAEGKRVQVIMLDTRYFRSPLKKSGRVYVPNEDPKATMLGEAQWKWLGEQLRKPAEVRLIGSSIQMVPEDHIYEKWTNIPAERAKFFELIRETEAEGVIVLSGDRHLAELSMMDAGIGYPLYDMTSSGLNQASLRWRPLEVNRHRVATMGFGNNFGLIEIDWESEVPTVELQIRDEAGKITIRQELPLTVLKRGTLTGGAPLGAPKRIEGVLTADQALKQTNSIATVRVKVQSTGQSGNGEVIYLNSRENFRDEENFTVMLIVNDLKKDLPELTRDTFANVTVEISGLIEANQNGPRMVVRDASKLKKIEE